MKKEPQRSDISETTQATVYTGPIRDRVWGIIQLIRPLNVLLFAVGTLLGGVLGRGVAALEGGGLHPLLWAAGSAALIGGAANSLNDAFDLDVDRLNRPNRPLPSGRLSPRTAWILWGLGTAAGLAMSIRLTWTHAVMAGAAAALLFAYNARWKHVPGLGNVVVAFVVALTLVYGGRAVGGPVGSVLVGAVFAFLTTLAREVVKDVQDVRGDAAVGARTLPLAWSVEAAWRVAAGLVALTVALTPLPFLALGYPGVYLIGVSFADFALLRVLSVAAASPTAGRAAQASRLLKGAMVFGMAALAVASLAR